MKSLLELARQAIESYLDNEEIEVPELLKKKNSEKQACFVTLTLNGQLRGCIGTLYPRQELWKDVKENAINAAFNDPRFYPLKREELGKIKIEISILSIPERLEFKDPEELLRKINNKMGIILRKGHYTSTYLPQVWEQLTKKEEFLESLCIKAGLKKNEWKEQGIEVYTYAAKKISERQ
jgi:AmmeMemoRadiSam system protein A